MFQVPSVVFQDPDVFLLLYFIIIHSLLSWKLVHTNFIVQLCITNVHAVCQTPKYTYRIHSNRRASRELTLCVYWNPFSASFSFLKHQIILNINKVGIFITVLLYLWSFASWILYRLQYCTNSDNIHFSRAFWPENTPWASIRALASIGMNTVCFFIFIHFCWPRNIIEATQSQCFQEVWK